MNECPLHKRVKAYAFNHGCDFNEAALRVMYEVMDELRLGRIPRDRAYDLLFDGKENECDETDR